MDKQRHIIASVIKGKASDIHNEMVQLISTKFNLKHTITPTHITFKDSFYTNDLTEISSAIKKSIQGSKPGGITIGGIKDFRKKIIFQYVDIDSETLSFMEILLKNLKPIAGLEWDEFDNMARHFHLTITQNADGQNFKKIMKLLTPYKDIVTDCKLDNISILQKQKEGHWVVVKGFKI